MSASMIPRPEGAKQDLENPTDAIHTVNFVTQALTIALCTIFCAIRAIQKLRVPTLHLVYDDYLTLISYILLVGYCGGGISLGVHGGGYHAWEVPQESLEPYLKSMYATTIFYPLMTLFIKLSILALIARIFAPYKRRMQGIYAFAILLIIYYLTSLILKIRVCMPVSAYWKGEMDKCIDQTAVFTADSLISTVTDAIILVLPLPMTWSLQISFQKKLRVGGMLAVGGLATAFSAWRLHLVLNEGKSQDLTIFFIQVVLTGNAEAGIALICCCLPAAVGQFKFLRDRVGYGSSNNTNGKYNTNSSANLTTLTSRKAAARRQWQDNTRTSLDEVELVAHAQGNTTPAIDLDHPGIMRKVEVTHAVSYYGSDASSDHASKDESKSEKAERGMN